MVLPSVFYLLANQHAVFGIDADNVSCLHIAAYNFPGNKRFNARLQIALEWSCTIDWVISAVYDKLFCAIGNFKSQIALTQSSSQRLGEDIHNMGKVFFTQGLEAYYLVKAVQEFRSEGSLKLCHNHFPRRLFNLSLCADSFEEMLTAKV